MGAYDGYKYAKKKGYKGWKMYASIAGGAALGAVNPFKIFKMAKSGYKAYKAVKYTKKARNVYKKTKRVVKVRAKPKPTVVAKKQVKSKAKVSKTKKSTRVVKKQTKKIQIKSKSKGKSSSSASLALNAPENKNPWKEGKKIISMEAPDDFYINMAMSKGQKNPGNWGTLDDIPDVSYVRNQLAVTPEFKETITHVQKFKVPKGTRIQIGIVGPQEYKNVIYPGGGTQVQIISLPSGRMLEPVGSAQRIY